MPRGGDTTGAVTGVDFSLLDVPRDRPVEDPDAFLRAAIAWHFGADPADLRIGRNHRGTEAHRPAA
ncbi:hypothetical protein MGALJ_24480 [Mycobacterium gallinarum]|uniref:Uncharacterized protein n=1 Tax=Mycobacterium gallinarum TaxID=39689 RepID=A0A9W4B2I5_9MYCO|nr:hypothetical protein MGALJ_24480 [Mycobacterium gallinarum]